MKKPEIFQEMDDALFNRLPINYTLMRKIDPFPAVLAASEYFRTRFFVCEPVAKPVSKILTDPEEEHG